MNGVAAEIAKEVGVLLEHQDINTSASEQETEDHSSRAAAGDHALVRSP
jgi:hypothetical protein